MLAGALAVWGCRPDQPAAREATSSESLPATVSPVVDSPTAALDPELVRLGRQLFQAKGCVGCHTIGNGRLTGPDLEGVTQRREFEWIVAMVTTPDSMLREDPVARQLFAEYMTPMVTVGANREEATAIHEFLRAKAR